MFRNHSEVPLIQALSDGELPSNLELTLTNKEHYVKDTYPGIYELMPSLKNGAPWWMKDPKSYISQTKSGLWRICAENAESTSRGRGPLPMTVMFRGHEEGPILEIFPEVDPSAKWAAFLALVRERLPPPPGAGT